MTGRLGSRPRSPLLLGLFVGLLSGLVPGDAPAARVAVQEAALPLGRLVERREIPGGGSTPAHSYAFYLPTGYRAESPAPIVYLFDSKGRGADLARPFVAAAERFGFVLASSNDTSNLGSMEPNFALAAELWRDTHERLAIDDRRVYAVGFSGMSRFVCTLAFRAPGSLAAVIGASGGYPLGRPPSADAPFPFFGLVGDLDFNWYEMLDVEERLAAAGTRHRLELFTGSHEFPPAEAAGRALAWLELLAMRKGQRPPSPQLAREILTEDAVRARDLAASGERWRAWRIDRSIVQELGTAGELGLADGEPLGAEIEAARARFAATEADPSFARERKERAARDDRDRVYLEDVPRRFARLVPDPSPERLSEALTSLGIPDLQTTARTATDPEERRSAERRLYAVYIQTGLYLPRLFSGRAAYGPAIFFLEIARAIRPDVPHIAFRLAVAHAGRGNPKKAIEELERAAALGWDDRTAIENEKVFDPLRKNPRFAAVLARVLRMPG